MATIHKMFYPVVDKKNPIISKTKISIIGVGQVGTASAYSILVQGVCSDLVLIDVNETKVNGEVLDLQHCQQFIQPTCIIGSTDFEATANSDIVVITAGVRQRKDELRYSLIQRNVDTFKVIIPQIVEYSPSCIIIIASSPVDILAYVAWRLSGFTRNRVFGMGTMLDSARFRSMIGTKLQLDSDNCHAYILGEHGTNSVAVWSSANIGGVFLNSVNPEIGTDKDTENFADMHKYVVKSSKSIIKLKGYCSWSMGLCVSTVCKYIIHHRTKILPLSTLTKHDGALKGFQGIDRDVFLSLPCIVTSCGISHIVPPSLSDDEKEQLFQSAKRLEDDISNIEW